MRRGAAHLTVVVGDPAKADQLRCALEEHGVDHAAVVAGVNSIRRSLVLGENEFVVVCIALDRPTIARHGPALRSLLSDNQCFPTAVRTVGLLSDLGLTREAAELGCDVYVEDSAQAANAIRLLDDAWSGGGEDGEPREFIPRRQHLRIRGGWMYGTPELPAELTSLVSSDSPHGVEGPGEDFGGRVGPR
jgi:hypothetical protein